MGVNLSPGDAALWVIAIGIWVLVLFGANLIS